MRHRSVLTVVMVALALAPAAAWAQKTPDPPGFNGRYGPVGKFYDEYKAGTLSADDYQKLVQMRDDMVGGVFDNMAKNASRAGLTKDAINTTMSNVGSEFTDAVRAGDSQGAADAAISGNHQVTTQVAIPASIQAGIVVDDLTDITIKLYQARGQMGGANPDAIDKQVNSLQMFKSAADANLYVVRQKLQDADTSLQMDPAVRQQLTDKIDQGMKNGDIAVDADGNLNVSAVLKKTGGIASVDGNGLPANGNGSPSGTGNGGNTGVGNTAGNAANTSSGNTGASSTANSNNNGTTAGNGASSGEPSGSGEDDTVVITDHYKLDGKGSATYTGSDYNPGNGSVIHTDANGNETGTSRPDGGGGAAGGSGGESGVWSGGNSEIADAVSDLTGGSAAFDAIYANYTFTGNGNGDSTVAVPSTQVAGPSHAGNSADTHPQGPSSALNSPDTHPQGPSSATNSGSSAGVQGPSSTMTTGSSAGVQGPSSTMTGPSSAMTGPSTQVTGPSSALGAGADTPAGPQTGGDNSYSVSNNDDGQPSLCGR